VDKTRPPPLSCDPFPSEDLTPKTAKNVLPTQEKDAWQQDYSKKRKPLTSPPRGKKTRPKATWDAANGNEYGLLGAERRA